jgi:hypothetical protein
MRTSRRPSFFVKTEIQRRSLTKISAKMPQVIINESIVVFTRFVEKIVVSRAWNSWKGSDLSNARVLAPENGFKKSGSESSSKLFKTVSGWSLKKSSLLYYNQRSWSYFLKNFHSISIKISEKSRKTHQKVAEAKKLPL